MPVQLLSRQDDPVGNGGKGVQAAKKQPDAAWMKDVTLHLLPGTRHIVLDERGSGAADEAIRMIVGWLNA